MFRRRYAFLALPMAITLCGCDSDPGPVVPATVEKTKEATAATPAVKTTEGGRPVSASEPAQGGPPTKGTP